MADKIQHIEAAIESLTQAGYKKNDHMMVRLDGDLNKEKEAVLANDQRKDAILKHLREVSVEEAHKLVAECLTVLDASVPKPVSPAAVSTPSSALLSADQELKIEGYMDLVNGHLWLAEQTKSPEKRVALETAACAMINAWNTETGVRCSHCQMILSSYITNNKKGVEVVRHEPTGTARYCLYRPSGKY